MCRIPTKPPSAMRSLWPMESAFRRSFRKPSMNSLESLSYIGALGADEDSRELLEFHSLLLCQHLGYLNEVHQYHQSFPWKVILSLQVSGLEGLMDEMRSLWEFITENIDVCPPKSPLFKACGWTRAQCFREVFIVAELLALIWRKHLQLFP